MLAMPNYNATAAEAVAQLRPISSNGGTLIVVAAVTSKQQS
jgi:hypothetical protein